MPVAEPITLTRALHIYSDLSPIPSPMGAKEEGRAYHQKNYVELVLGKIMWNWFSEKLSERGINAGMEEEW